MKSFLMLQILTNSTIEFMMKMGNFKTRVFRGYELEQTFEVQSKSVDAVEKTSREVSKLIDAGIELNSFAPQYYYTKLAALKIKMIEAATKDAKNRAETIATNGGGVLGKLTYASMGGVSNHS